MYADVNRFVGCKRCDILYRIDLKAFKFRNNEENESSVAGNNFRRLIPKKV